MTVGELIAVLQRYDPNLRVGWYYDCKWEDVCASDIEFIPGTDEWGEPKEDSIQLCYS